MNLQYDIPWVDLKIISKFPDVNWPLNISLIFVFNLDNWVPVLDKTQPNVFHETVVIICFLKLLSRNLLVILSRSLIGYPFCHFELISLGQFQTFLFFYWNISHTTKSTKSTKTPRQKHNNANKRISDFFPLRCFLSTKNAAFFIFACLYAFCAFCCLWNLPIKKYKKFKTVLITSFTLLLTISVLFMVVRNYGKVYIWKCWH